MWYYYSSELPGEGGALRQGAKRKWQRLCMGQVTEALVGPAEPGGLVLLTVAALEEGGTSEAG